MSAPSVPHRWWVSPLIFSAFLATGLVTTWIVSETAREVLAKAVMTLAGAMATPFILESTVAIVGLVIVIVINQIRLQREGDGWVYLAKTEPDADSVAQGADTPARRLDAVVLPAAPDPSTDLGARLAMVEGYLELGLKQEATAHLQMLNADERQDLRAQELGKRVGSQ